jgi:hypothetical protein
MRDFLANPKLLNLYDSPLTPTKLNFLGFTYRRWIWPKRKSNHLPPFNAEAGIYRNLFPYRHDIVHREALKFRHIAVHLDVLPVYISWWGYEASS